MSLSVGTDAEASVFQRNCEGSNTLGPSIRAWVYGHTRKLVEPAGLAIATGDTFPKEGQSWSLGLSIQKDRVLSFPAGHECYCVVGVDL